MSAAEKFNETERVDDLTYHLNQVEKEVYRIKIDNNRNFHLCKYCDDILERIEKVRILSNYQIRFAWQQIQKEIDDCFKKDKSITGIRLIIDFKETDIPNRAFINCKIYGEKSSK